MGEKWFEFVKRIKKEGNHASLKDAMREASKRKSEWKKDGSSKGDANAAPKHKTMKESQGKEGNQVQKEPQEPQKSQGKEVIKSV